MIALRKIRLSAKVYWMALKVWRHTGQTRALKAKIEAHLAGTHSPEEQKKMIEALENVNASAEQMQEALRTYKNACSRVRS